jgi:DNA-binding XRE family transcriptional regulator
LYRPRVGQNIAPRGEKNGAAVLNDKQVRSARKRRKHETAQAIADDLGVSRSTIVAIATERTWKHLL